MLYGEVKSRALWWSLVSMFLVGVLPGLSGCRSAGFVEDGVFLAPNRFDVEAPEGARWRQVVNRSLGERTKVIYKRIGGGGWIRFEVSPELDAERELPLDILANKMFVQKSIARGGTLRAESLNRIVLDEREAVALTGMRYDRPYTWLETLIVLRSQGFVVSMGLSARTDKEIDPSREIGPILRSFKVRLPGEFDPFLLEDLPIGPPPRAPRNIYSPRRAPERAPMKPKIRF